MQHNASGESKSVIKKGFAYVKKFFQFIFNSRKAMASLTLVAAFVISLFSGITLAYNLIYNGRVIAIVRDRSEFGRAVEAAESMVCYTQIKNHAAAPEFSLTLTVGGNFTETEEIAKQIVENTDTLVKADALIINDNLVGCVLPEENLQSYYDAYLQSYNIAMASEGAVAESVFVDNVAVESGYYDSSKIVSVETLAESLNGLSVQTVVTATVETEIPFKTITHSSAEYELGQYVVSVPGVPGLKHSSTKTTYIDGVETSVEVLEDVVISEPSEAVVYAGTKRPYISPSLAAQIGELGFIRPLETYQLVTAYWGDGRGHKGIDIAAQKNTPIYAVQSGTVVTSTKNGSYGNYVIIDHGNGVQTLYAHCNARLVSAGEFVSQGTPIALVGTTGQSTGNHLHFELRINGTKVNPAPYIGF